MLSERVSSWRKDPRETDEKGNVLMTVPYIKQLCKEQKLYSTPYLNDKLYLHFKGFSKIQNLDVYTGLKTVWLEGNGIGKIEGFDEFLQQNCIEKIENLEKMVLLDTLNVSNNLLKRLDNLSELPILKTLQADRNFFTCADDIKELENCPSLTVVDLSHNKIDDPEIVNIFFKMPNLAVLNLMSNPVIPKIKNYRRTMIQGIKSLTYLDDRPVFEKERLAVEAWFAGGPEAEIEERQRQRQETTDEHNRGFEALRRLQEGNIQRRIETFGPDEPVVFSEPLERFRQEQLAKIEEPVESGPILEEIMGVAPSAEPESYKEATIEEVEEDEEDEPPVRQFASMDTSGLVLEREAPEDMVAPLIQEIPSVPAPRIQESVVEEWDSIQQASSNTPLQEHEIGAKDDGIPELEDASEEVEMNRQLRQEMKSTAVEEEFGEFVSSGKIAFAMDEPEVMEQEMPISSGKVAFEMDEPKVLEQEISVLIDESEVEDAYSKLEDID